MLLVNSVHRVPNSIEIGQHLQKLQSYKKRRFLNHGVDHFSYSKNAIITCRITRRASAGILK